MWIKFFFTSEVFRVRGLPLLTFSPNIPLPDLQSVAASDGSASPCPLPRFWDLRLLDWYIALNQLYLRPDISVKSISLDNQWTSFCCSVSGSPRARRSSRSRGGWGWRGRSTWRSVWGRDQPSVRRQCHRCLVGRSSGNTTSQWWQTSSDKPAWWVRTTSLYPGNTIRGSNLNISSLWYLGRCGHRELKRWKTA